MPALAFCADMLKHCDRYTGVLKTEPASGYDLRHTFRRTDGTVLTVMGRTSITGRWRLEGDILAVYDLFGAPVALKDGVTERPTEPVAAEEDRRIRGYRQLLSESLVRGDFRRHCDGRFAQRED